MNLDRHPPRAPRPARPACHLSESRYHVQPCICPDCRAPRPSDPPAHPLAGLTPEFVRREIAIPCLAGLIFGAGIVAATGNLGAALAALVGL